MVVQNDYWKGKGFMGMWGLDQLGAAKYGNLAVREHPEGWMFGVFTKVSGFGDAYPVVEQIAKSNRAPAIRLNLAWSDTHTFPKQDFKKIKAEALRFSPLVKKYPGIKWYVSGATEHQLNLAGAGELCNLVLSAFPEGSITYVNNPWAGKGAFISNNAVVNEVHGADAKPPGNGTRFGFSFDGSDCFDTDVTAIKQRMKDAEYFLFWTSQCNGRKNASDPTPRPQRKAYPTSELIDAMIYLHRDQGEVSLPKNYLLKPKSDQHSVPPEPRALKPVVIIPPKVDRIELVANNGQVVAVSEKPQPFADGRFRYYFTQFGYQISEKARRIHGSPVVQMRVGKKIVGTCNMAFRQGQFRD